MDKVKIIAQFSALASMPYLMAFGMMLDMLVWRGRRQARLYNRLRRYCVANTD
jgi:hypothetical protein